MNAPLTTVAAPTQPTSPLGLVIIAGRIRHTRSVKTQAGMLRLTLVMLPAASEFESPATVELRSTESLGSVGDTVKVRCRVGGRWRQYKATDNETGEVRQVQTADTTLTVAE